MTRPRFITNVFDTLQIWWWRHRLAGKVSPITEPGPMPILDMPADMTIAERRAEAEQWMTEQLSTYALPDNDIRNTILHYGVCETAEQLNDLSRRWSKPRMEYFERGFGEILDALDACPVSQPVTLWMYPNALIIQVAVAQFRQYNAARPLVKDRGRAAMASYSGQSRAIPQPARPRGDLGRRRRT